MTIGFGWLDETVIAAFHTHTHTQRERVGGGGEKNQMFLTRKKSATIEKYQETKKKPVVVPHTVRHTQFRDRIDIICRTALVYVFS